MKKFFNGLDQLNVPLLEVLRYQVGAVTGFWPALENTTSDFENALCCTGGCRMCTAPLFSHTGCVPFLHPHPGTISSTQLACWDAELCPVGLLDQIPASPKQNILNASLTEPGVAILYPGLVKRWEQQRGGHK